MMIHLSSNLQSCGQLTTLDLIRTRHATEFAVRSIRTQADWNAGLRHSRRIRALNFWHFACITEGMVHCCQEGNMTIRSILRFLRRILRFSFPSRFGWLVALTNIAAGMPFEWSAVPEMLMFGPVHLATLANESVPARRVSSAVLWVFP
jgi:hypothetical protein